MEKKMTQEDYLKVLKSLDEAQEDTTPYAAVIGDEIVVEGDPNNTKVVKQDYTLNFLFPEEKANLFPNAKKAGEGYVSVEIEYPGIFVDARNNLKYTAAMAQAMPFFRKLQDSGDVEDLTPDEAIELFASLEDEVVDALYHVVEVVLDVDKELVGSIAPGSAISVATRIIQDFPPIANQGDLFFGLPTGSQS